MLNEQSLLRIMSRYNPWWERDKKVPESRTSKFKRKDLYNLISLLPKKEIVSIMGPRRVGKTILMHQLVENLLEEGVTPTNILYFSVDNAELVISEASLSDLLETYFKFILNKPIKEIKEVVYIFLDEIQDTKNWSTILKNWYDYKYNIKFVISGSSSMDLSRGGEESLMGRLIPVIVLPLKFSEILRYQKVYDNFDFKELRGALISALDKEDPKIFFNEAQRIFGKTISLQNKIECLLDRYLIVGGYPEFLELEDFLQISQGIRTKLESTFYKDIVTLFRVKDPSVLDELFGLLCKSTSQKINISNMASDLGVERPTLKTYMFYFKKVFLLSFSEFYSQRRTSRLRKEKKVYVTDPGIRNTVLGYLDKDLLRETKELGSVVESVVLGHLKRLKFNLEPHLGSDVFYWGAKNGEIDFIVELMKKPIPIEVKYQNEITSNDSVQIKKFLTTFKKAKFGIIITKNKLELTENIINIPLWLFLLMV